eukprot:scaffold14366_cov208-Ochromonas_danica.AAC.7
MHILLKAPLYALGLGLAQLSPLWSSLIVNSMGQALGIQTYPSGAIDFDSTVKEDRQDTCFVRLVRDSSASQLMVMVPGLGFVGLFQVPLAVMAMLSHIFLAI